MNLLASNSCIGKKLSQKKKSISVTNDLTVLLACKEVEGKTPTKSKSHVSGSK